MKVFPSAKSRRSLAQSYWTNSAPLGGHKTPTIGIAVTYLSACGISKLTTKSTISAARILELQSGFFDPSPKTEQIYIRVNNFSRLGLTSTGTSALTEQFCNNSPAVGKLFCWALRLNTTTNSVELSWKYLHETNWRETLTLNFPDPFQSLFYAQFGSTGNLAYTNYKIWLKELSLEQLRLESDSFSPIYRESLLGHWPLANGNDYRDLFNAAILSTVFTRNFTHQDYFDWSDTAQKILYSYVSAVSGTVYTITPSGGIVFNGTSSQEVTKIILTSGGLDLSGVVELSTLRNIYPAGGIDFSGAIIISKTAQMTPVGGVTFAGAVPLDITRIIYPTGSIEFSGSVSLGGVQDIIVSGGITFNGASLLNSTLNVIPSGAIIFGGTVEFSRTYQLTPAGGITLSGIVPLDSTYNIYPSGDIVFSGLITLSNSRNIIPSGSIEFSGSIPVDYTSSIVPTGLVTFSGAVNMHFIPADGSGSGDGYVSRITVGSNRTIRIS